MPTAPTHANARARPPAAETLVSDAMHHGIVTCPRDTPLTDVAELMARHRIHAVVVTDASDDAADLWGVVSDLDLVAAASVRDLAEQCAGATAATAALSVAPTETLQRAAQLMTEHGTAHLVVVDTSRMRPVGVLSTLDVAAALAVT
jgi:CBS domain-containing protein